MNLKTILTRKAGAITDARAERLTGIGIRTSDEIVEERQRKVDSLEEKIEDLLDVSANVDHNAGQEKLTNESFAHTISEYHRYRDELEIAQIKLKVSKRINKSLKSK